MSGILIFCLGVLCGMVILIMLAAIYYNFKH